MASDIKLKTPDGRFKFRVCGILQIGKKYLTAKMNDNDFFCLLGGHVELGEDTEAAVLREMEEELGYEVKIKKHLAIIQSFFYEKDQLSHEIGYYYIVSPKDKKIEVEDYIRIENDKGYDVKLDFKWFTLKELKNIDFRPKILLKYLKSKKFKHIIDK